MDVVSVLDLCNVALGPASTVQKVRRTAGQQLVLIRNRRKMGGIRRAGRTRRSWSPWFRSPTTCPTCCCHLDLDNPQAPGHRRRIVSLGQQPENLELARGELSQKRLVLPLIGRQTALPRDGLREKDDRDQDLFLSRAPHRIQYLLGRS